MKLIWYSVPLVVLGVGAFLSMGHSPGAVKRSTPVHSGDVYSQPPAAPLVQVVRVPVREEVSGAREPSGQKDAPAAEVEPPPTEAESLEQLKERQLLALVVMDSEFDAEKLDTNWARSAAASLSASLSNRLGSESRLESLECRASLCRAEIVHGQESERLAFLNRSFGQPAMWPGETLAVKDGEGTGERTVMFFAREGRHLDPGA